MILNTSQVYWTQLVPTKYSQIQWSSPSSPDSPKFSGFTETHQIKQLFSRMPLTNAQKTFFFKDTEIINIWHDTVVKLQEEGIKDVNDL